MISIGKWPTNGGFSKAEGWHQLFIEGSPESPRQLVHLLVKRLKSRWKPRCFPCQTWTMGAYGREVVWLWSSINKHWSYHCRSMIAQHTCHNVQSEQSNESNSVWIPSTKVSLFRQGLILFSIKQCHGYLQIFFQSGPNCGWSATWSERLQLNQAQNFGFDSDITDDSSYTCVCVYNKWINKYVYIYINIVYIYIHITYKLEVPWEALKHY